MSITLPFRGCAANRSPSPKDARSRSSSIEEGEIVRSDRPHHSSVSPRPHGGFGVDTHLGHGMRMEVDPTHTMMGGLEQTPPDAVPHVDRAALKPTDISGISTAEREEYNLEIYERRERARNERFPAEKQQNNSEQAKLEQANLGPQVGDKRPRSPDSLPPTTATAIALENRVEADEPTQTDASTTFRSMKSTKCAIRIDRGPIIGTLATTQCGFGLKVVIHSDRSGEPSIP